MSGYTLKSMARMGPVIMLALCASLLLGGCSAKRLTQRLLGGMTDSFSAAFYQQRDPQLAREGGAAFLLTLDSLIHRSPDNQDLLLAAVQSYTAYASAFLVEDEPDRAFMAYSQALDYANQVLLARYGTTFSDPLDNLETAAADWQQDDVPVLYWTASALSGWIVTHDDQMLALADLSKALLLMEKALSLNPEYQNGSIHIFWGIYHASRSPVLGGNPEKSREHFQAAIHLGGNDALLPKVLFAQYYAKAMFDEELFRNTLEDVLSAPPAQNENLHLMNALARAKATRLLAAVADIF